MNTVIITGASSGIGKVFCQTIKKYYDFEQLVIIARRRENLEKLKEELPFPVKILPLDLTDQKAFDQLSEFLEQEKPQVSLLINCSGFGKFGASLEEELSVNLNMIDLNCKAIVSMCQTVIPYIIEGGRIINVASVAALQPIPYIAVYGASKAFVLSYSRALNRELKKNKISITAVCPFWTKTEFFNRAVDDKKEPVVKKYIAMYTPEQIVNRALKDAKKRKDVSFYGFKARSQAMLVKLLPHSLVMSVWQSQQKLK